MFYVCMDMLACAPLTCLHCYVPSIIPCVLLAGYASLCPSDMPALFSFAQHHTCIWIPPTSAASE